MLSAWRTDIGKVRRENQDRVATSDTVVAVADGVGSTRGAAAVAGFAVREFVERAARARSETDVVVAVHEVQRASRAAVRAGALLGTGATTLTAAVLIGAEVVVVNVGDSPAWVLEPGRPRLLTSPHRRWDPLRQAHVLLASIGPHPPATVTSCRIPLLSKQIRLVIASDGVLDPDEPDITPPLLDESHRGTADEAATAIVAGIMTGAATDNVTVAVVDVRD